MLSGSGMRRFFAWMRSMRDLMRDWRRWRFEERVMAILIMGSAIGLPLAFAIAAELR